MNYTDHAYSPLDNGRATLNVTAGGLDLTVPAYYLWVVRLLLPLWLGGWTMGFVTAGGTLWGSSGFGELDLFLTFWLLAWTAGGALASATLLWMWFGKERLEIHGQTVRFHRGVFGVGITKELQRAQVRNVRFEQLDTDVWKQRNNLGILGWGKGKIKFDYGLKTYTFALGVDDAEARYLVERIARAL